MELIRHIAYLECACHNMIVTCPTHASLNVTARSALQHGEIHGIGAVPMRPELHRGSVTQVWHLR